jgi:steroid 5-alpha reductase family enzyme
VVVPVLISYAVLVVMMTIIWLVFRRINNAAIVDVGWGSGFVIVGIVYAAMGEGLLERRILVGALMILWGGRLAWHLLRDRVLSGKPEDGRYQDIRARWRDGINTKFFFFFQAQALLVVLFSLPMLLVASNTASTIGALEWISVVIWLMGVVGESAADNQLKRFKDDPANKGKTCQAGLWRYSRHPNYFFEWVIWVAYSLLALGAPYGWIGFISPLGMLYILLRVTGVSLTEEHALRTRGEAYREYQRTTSMFIPLPPKVRRKEMLG